MWHWTAFAICNSGWWWRRGGTDTTSTWCLSTNSNGIRLSQERWLILFPLAGRPGSRTVGLSWRARASWQLKEQEGLWHLSGASTCPIQFYRVHTPYSISEWGPQTTVGSSLSSYTMPNDAQHYISITSFIVNTFIRCILIEILTAPLRSIQVGSI